MALAHPFQTKNNQAVQDEALARFEAASAVFTTYHTRRASNKELTRAINAWRKGEAAKAAKHALAATEIDDTNAQAYHLLAIVLDKLGHLDKSLLTFERAFALDPDDPDLPLNLGLTAWAAGNVAGAERMFRLFIEKRPERPEGYNNLGSVLRDSGKLDDAIETLKLAIYKMPNEAMLWNTLATVLSEEGRAEEGLVFYQEALRLDPNFARVYHNLGYAYSHLGQLENARAAYDKALELTGHVTDRIEARHSRSVCLMGLGEIAEGFAEYEVRNDPSFRGATIPFSKAPVWNGEDLAGKRILVMGEQGLGDEIMFANIVPDLMKAVGETGKVQLALDPRLIPLFQRSYPAAECGTYDDRKFDGHTYRLFEWARKNGEPDFYAPMGTPLQFFRKSVSDFPRQAFLTPDPERAASFKTALAGFGPGPYVGICWRSMVMDHLRRKYYSALEAWAPILKTPGVTFVNLQYGDCKDDLAMVKEKFGITIHAVDGLDLKADIDGAAALSAACDLAVSAPTSVGAIAGSVGTEVWFLVAGRVWPQLGTDHYPWYRSTKVFMPEKFADWDALLPKVADSLQSFAAGKDTVG